jgi:aryl-alcohol dehydrogenase-like predicted oxidoreductase
LEALAELVKTGKVRHIGISNETPWGLMQYLKYAENNDMPRICSIQNPYNLLNRSFEIGLAEIACREQVGLLAYSPLAFAVLSGKYLNEQKPTGSRLTLFEHYTRYSNNQAEQATAAYVSLAKDHDLDPTQMALAFIQCQPFVTSAIVGATNIEQLASNIASIELELSEGCISGIENIHQNKPNPCP